jgi:hypothetical protein
MPGKTGRQSLGAQQMGLDEKLLETQHDGLAANDQRE